MKAISKPVLTKSSPNVAGVYSQTKPPNLPVKGFYRPATSPIQCAGISVVTSHVGKLACSSNVQEPSTPIGGEMKDVKIMSQQWPSASQAPFANNQFTPMTSSVSKQKQVTSLNTTLPHKALEGTMKIDQAHASSSYFGQQSAPVATLAPLSTVETTPVSMSEISGTISACGEGQEDSSTKVTQSAGQDVDNEQFQQFLISVLETGFHT